MKNKIIAIRRDVRYSLDAEQKDREVLASVIQCLGGDIPMIDEARSLNLSNAVAIISYELLRQTGFPGLKQEGQIPKGDGQ